jgi:hypothetical protein
MDPKPISSKPHYLRFASLSLALAGLILLVLPLVLRFYDAGAGGFTVDQFNVLALGAVLLLATVHLAFFVYRRLFPRFYEYQRECLESEGKLFENLTEELRGPLYDEGTIYAARLAQLIERRKLAQFQFTIRCVRFLLCFSVLAYLLWLATHMLTVAMLATPTASAPVSLL